MGIIKDNFYISLSFEFVMQFSKVNKEKMFSYLLLFGLFKKVFVYYDRWASAAYSFNVS